MPPVTLALASPALLAGGFAFKAIREKLKTPSAGEVDRGFDLSRKLDPNYPREVAVGRFATGGSGVYDTVSGEENKYVWRVTAISDYEITAIHEIWIDGQRVTLSGDPLNGWVSVTDHLTKENGEPTIRFRIMRGTEDQALDSQLASVAGPGSYGGELTASDTFAGMAIAIMRWEYSPDDNITSEPSQIVYVGDGAPVHDPRDQDSNPNDPNTWSRTSDARFNPALVTAQAIRGWKRGGEVIVGAHGIVSADISDASLASEANICDEQVETAEGTERRYRCGGMIRMDPDDGIRPSLEKSLAAMDGDITEAGGVFTILAGAERIPEQHYDMQALKGQTTSFNEHGSATQRFNETACSFVNPDNAWEMENLPAYAPAEHLEDDGGRHRVQSLALDFVYSRYQAARIQKAKHERSRLFSTATFELPMIAEQTEPGDWFTVTDQKMGLVGSVWEAVTVSRVNTPQGCRVIIQAEGISVEPWSWGQEAANDVTVPVLGDYPGGELPDPAVPVLTISATEVRGGGTVFPAILATFEVAESPLETHIEFEYWPYDDETKIRSARGLKSAGRLVLTGGVAPSTEYRVRARLIGGLRVGRWSEPSSVTTTGDMVSTRAIGSVTQDDIDEALSFLASANPEVASGLATLTQVGAINRIFDPLFQLGIRDNTANGILEMVDGDPRSLQARLSIGTADTVQISLKPKFELRSGSRMMLGAEITLAGTLSEAAIQVRFFDADEVELGSPVEVGRAVSGARAEGFLEPEDIPEDTRFGQMEIVSSATSAGTAGLQVHHPFAAYAGPNQTVVEAFKDPQDEVVARIISKAVADQARALEIDGLTYETAVSRAAILVLQEVTQNVARYQTSVTYEGADGVSYALSELYAADGISRILQIAGVIALANPSGEDGVTVAMEVRNGIVHFLTEARLAEDAAFTHYTGDPGVLRMCLGKNPTSGNVGLFLYDETGEPLIEFDATSNIAKVHPAMATEGFGGTVATGYENEHFFLPNNGVSRTGAQATGAFVPLAIDTGEFMPLAGQTVLVKSFARLNATSDMFDHMHYQVWVQRVEVHGVVESVRTLVHLTPRFSVGVSQGESSGDRAATGKFEEHNVQLPFVDEFDDPLPPTLTGVRYRFVIDQEIIDGETFERFNDNGGARTLRVNSVMLEASAVRPGLISMARRQSASAPISPPSPSGVPVIPPGSFGLQL